MKIKLGDQHNPQKPGHTAVVVPHGVPNSNQTGTRHEFNKDKSATCLGAFHVIFGLIIMVTGIVSYIKSDGEYFMCWNTYFGMPFVITGFLAIGAAKKKTRCLIIAFMVLAILSLIVSFRPSGNSLMYLYKEHSKVQNYQGWCGTDALYPEWDDLMNGNLTDSPNRTMNNNETHMAEWRRHPIPKAMPSMVAMYSMKPLEMSGNIISIIIGVSEMIISIASIAICAKVVCSCCSQQQHNATYWKHQQPMMVYPVNPTSPTELSPKLLAEEAWNIKNPTPPEQHLY